jgi:dienelactone hydrolase
MPAAGFVSKFVVHPGTQHGYAVRGSKSDPRVNEAREDALKQAIGFFNTCFEYANT